MWLSFSARSSKEPSWSAPLASDCTLSCNSLYGEWGHLLELRFELRHPVLRVQLHDLLHGLLKRRFRELLLHFQVRQRLLDECLRVVLLLLLFLLVLVRFLAHS